MRGKFHKGHRHFHPHVNSVHHHPHYMNMRMFTIAVISVFALAGIVAIGVWVTLSFRNRTQNKEEES